MNPHGPVTLSAGYKPEGIRPVDCPVMRVGQVFTYRGPFPWQCCWCPHLVRPGQPAVHLWQGTRLMMAHEPGSCPGFHVAIGGIEPPATRLWAGRSAY